MLSLRKQKGLEAFGASTTSSYSEWAVEAALKLDRNCGTRGLTLEPNFEEAWAMDKEQYSKYK
jgi:hypothetical protein